MPATEGFLRQRKPTAPPNADASAIATDSSVVEDQERKDVGEIVWGKTPGGEGACAVQRALRLADDVTQYSEFRRRTMC